MPPTDPHNPLKHIKKNKLSTNRKRKLKLVPPHETRGEDTKRHKTSHPIRDTSSSSTKEDTSSSPSSTKKDTSPSTSLIMNNRGMDSYTAVKNPGIAALCNLGNTCFLNSVLYTLRFTPGFCHNLHHLHEDLVQAHGGFKNKSPNWQNDDCTEQELVADVIETLHVLFKSLCAGDCGGEQVQPSSLLHSIGRLCPLFEGNQQQDAHELLVTLLNTLQEVNIPEIPSIGLEKNGAHPLDTQTMDSKKLSKKKSSKNFLHSGGSSTNSLLYSSNSSITGGNNTVAAPVNNCVAEQNGVAGLKISESHEKRINFVKEDFMGKSTMKTRCLECETSTFRSETFTNIDIPIHLDEEEDETRSNFFLNQILASETVRDGNKYWCSECSRLNEARRTVQYEFLPNVLTLQLKRFTTTGTKYLSKITDFIPTPFTMDCFCVECRESPDSTPRNFHKYQLYAVILHLGATLASGHYIAYVRAGDTSLDYFQCRRPCVSPGDRSAKPQKKGLFNKMFSKSNSNNSSSSSVPSKDSTVTGVSDPVCASLACCGLKVNNVTLENNSNDVRGEQVNGGGGGGENGRLNGGVSNGSLDSSGYNTGSYGGTPVPEDYWLECDDEQISVITRRQFEGILSTKQSATTPYLLFYHKIQ